MKTKQPTLAEIDGLIQSGKGAVARGALRARTRKKVKREDAASIARLAWRADLPLLGLRILAPIVRASRPARIPPSDREKLEYAACLVRIDAGDEALVILGDLKSRSHSEALLYEAYVWMSQWDYARVVPLLERYCAAGDLTPYGRTVGKVNLAAAYVHERRHEDALSLLADLKALTQKEGWNLLYGNVLELAAENHLHRGEFAKARAALDRAAVLLNESESLEAFFVRKWQALTSLAETRDEATADRVREIAREAETLKHWESVRDCERFLAVARRDEMLLRHLYFGTPHASFRERMIADFGHRPEWPAVYTWRLGEGATESFDLEACGESMTALSFRLLRLLCSDFYAGFRLAAIHQHLFPGEFFNPISSPKRVHAVINRVRGWLNERAVPLLVAEEEGCYRLRAVRSLAISLGTGAPSSIRFPQILGRLKIHYGAEAFSVPEAAQFLDVSPRSVQRALDECVKNGLVERWGKARATRYRFGSG